MAKSTGTIQQELEPVADGVAGRLVARHHQTSAPSALLQDWRHYEGMLEKAITRGVILTRRRGARPGGTDPSALGSRRRSLAEDVGRPVVSVDPFDHEYGAVRVLGAERENRLIGR